MAQLLAASVYAAVQWIYQPQEQIIWWLLGLVLLLLIRGALAYRFARLQHDCKQLLLWRRLFRFGMLGTAAGFGSIGLLFLPGVDVANQMFTLMLLVGIAAAALTVLAYDFPSFLIYVTSLLTPTFIVSLSYGDPLHLSVALLLVGYYLLLLRSSRKMDEMVKSSLLLRYEKQALVDNLEQEKTRLDNRLGRILNDSSNEIYVLDADSLVCMQVNMGVTQNLGYPEEVMVGKSILEILVDMDRNRFYQLVQPLIEGAQETVFYEGRHRRRDGTSYDFEGHLQLSTEEEPPVFVATVIDITGRKEAERKLLQQANYDQLTELPNRYYMLQRIKDAFARAERERRKVALLFIDLDNFKKINDTLGHRTGDEMLKKAADRIRSVLRQSDTPARLGGDEFLVMLEGLRQVEQTEVVARKLIDVFEKPFSIESREVFATASIGISLYPDDGESADLLLQHADTAMYQAKSNGRSGFQYFSQNMREAAETQMLMETHLRRALENDEFHLVYQPKVEVSSGRIVGAEALLRWESPELGFVPPDRFIGLAENIGLIQVIGNWVLETACTEAKEWLRLSDTPLHVAVNVSSHQFRQGRLLKEVDRVLRDTGLPVAALELEITESLLMQDTPEVMQNLRALTDQGIRLALDDFGTGYSSLSYLKRFPLQVLKIDRSFVRDLAVDGNDKALVDAIIAMAQSLNLEVVAEGVENQVQLDLLCQQKVGLVQGYYFSKPVREAEFRALLMAPVLAAGAKIRIAS
jgi:diguanylate cyclase (GGDEF)-like protein/PAS domain S-box-containing protein